MKILHIGQMIGGLDIYIRNTIIYADTEFEYVVVRGKKDNSKPILKNGKAIKECQVEMYRSIGWRDILCVFQTLRIAIKEKPDVIHCHSAKGGMVGRLIGFILRKKTFYTPHAFSFLSSQGSLGRSLFSAIERYTKFNAYILACSGSEAELAQTVAHYKPDRVLIWTNSVPDAAKNIPEKDGKQDNGQPIMICTIGRPSYQKNSLFLAEVAKNVISQCPNVKFMILGVGHYSPFLNDILNIIKENRLEDRIELIPWLEQKEILKYVNSSDLYLSTSLYEGLPLAIVEAMSLGKPIIASKVVGNIDCVEDNVNGFLLDLDANVFVDKIVELVADQEQKLLKDLGRGSRKLFESKFNLEIQINHLLDIYTNAVVGKR